MPHQLTTIYTIVFSTVQVCGMNSTNAVEPYNSKLYYKSGLKASEAHLFDGRFL